jgi:hypothetical protein
MYSVCMCVRVCVCVCVCMCVCVCVGRGVGVEEDWNQYYIISHINNEAVYVSADVSVDNKSVLTTLACGRLSKAACEMKNALFIKVADFSSCFCCIMITLLDSSHCQILTRALIPDTGTSDTRGHTTPEIRAKRPRLTPLESRNHNNMTDRLKERSSHELSLEQFATVY